MTVGGGHTGTLNVKGDISATTDSLRSGTGLLFDDADGEYTFNGDITLGGGDNGILINGNSEGTFKFVNLTNITPIPREAEVHIFNSRLGIGIISDDDTDTDRDGLSDAQELILSCSTIIKDCQTSVSVKNADALFKNLDIDGAETAVSIEGPLESSASFNKLRGPASDMTENNVGTSTVVIESGSIDNIESDAISCLNANISIDSVDFGINGEIGGAAIRFENNNMTPRFLFVKNSNISAFATAVLGFETLLIEGDEAGTFQQINSPLKSKSYGANILISDNTITSTGSDAVKIRLGGTNGGNKVQITNNLITASGDSGITVQLTDSISALVTLTGNDVSAADKEIVLTQDSNSIFKLADFAGGDSAAVAAFIQNNNVGTPSVSVSGSISAGHTGSADNTITANIPYLAITDSVTIMFRSVIADTSNGKTITNAVSVICAQLDYNRTNDIVSVKIAVQFATPVNSPEFLSAPTKFYLSQNYPNPFNPTTSIRYAIPQTGLVTLKIFNLLGEEIATLLNETQEAGSYKVEFNGTQF